MNFQTCSPFPLAKRSASSWDKTALILALVQVVLQKGVLVPVQVVHQVTIATILGDEIQRSWLEGGKKKLIDFCCFEYIKHVNDHESKNISTDGSAAGNAEKKL